jgi:hypothetical protein
VLGQPGLADFLDENECGVVGGRAGNGEFDAKGPKQKCC